MTPSRSWLISRWMADTPRPDPLDRWAAEELEDWAERLDWAHGYSRTKMILFGVDRATNIDLGRWRGFGR